MVTNRLNKYDGNNLLKFLSTEKKISDQVIDHSRSMISIINRNYIYEKVNATFCREHQVVNESIVGRSLADVWGSETFQNQIKNNIDKCFSGNIIKYEASFNTPRLGKRYYEVVFRPLAIGQGEITHLLAETFDINDLKLSRQEALDREGELRKFETNLPIGFLRCKPDGKIIHANNSFLRILESPDDASVINMNLKSFYPVEVLFDIQFDQLLECHSKSFGRIYLKNWEGNEIPCRFSGFLSVNASGTPLFIDFAVEDMSRELMLENRLLQAQKLETIGSLAGGIAHDFNNILATISGYSEMLQEDIPKNSSLSEKVSKIQGAVLKARSITNQILTFSRQVEQEKIPISVSEVLNETIGFVRSSLPSNIIIKQSIPNNGEHVLADPTQLFRVFINLMTNAIQSLEENGGTLSVSLSVVEGRLVQHELKKDIVADEYVFLTFEDTGKGMEPSLLDRIFEPFFTTREVGKGTGLGLSVAHGIITELEGEILVSSNKVKGSVFNVYLPVSKKYEDSFETKKGTGKILFISGNKHESRILSMALENSGYDIIYISDHHNLLKVMSLVDEQPDLIIYMSDSKQIQPEDLIGIFHQLNIITPCILITDNNQDIIQEKLLNSGIIKHHLIKPLSLKEMRNAIQIYLK